MLSGFGFNGSNYLSFFFSFAEFHPYFYEQHAKAPFLEFPSFNKVSLLICIYIILSLHCLFMILLVITMDGQPNLKIN